MVIGPVVVALKNTLKSKTLPRRPKPVSLPGAIHWVPAGAWTKPGAVPEMTLLGIIPIGPPGSPDRAPGPTGTRVYAGSSIQIGGRGEGPRQNISPVPGMTVGTTIASAFGVK